MHHFDIQCIFPKINSVFHDYFYNTGIIHFHARIISFKIVSSALWKGNLDLKIGVQKLTIFLKSSVKF